MDNKAQRVREILMDSLFRDEEIPNGKEVPDDAVIVDGIMGKYGFNPQRLESHRTEVVEILKDMPDEFFPPAGGWSFLNLCMDKSGVQWAEHPTMNDLCCLAIGLNLGKFLLPREMWKAFPGGMPYVGFDLSA